MTLPELLLAANDGLVARAKMLAADRDAMGAIRLLDLARRIRDLARLA